mmetsp:Transcript_39126/g.74979  ORF Transcript_39126/g.74979 Transcript_39126/m.74979 type:complete len:492 (+) Transcript_39126:247-1722(+)
MEHAAGEVHAQPHVHGVEEAVPKRVERVQVHDGDLRSDCQAGVRLPERRRAPVQVGRQHPGVHPPWPQSRQRVRGAAVLALQVSAPARAPRVRVREAELDGRARRLLLRVQERGRALRRALHPGAALPSQRLLRGHQNRGDHQARGRHAHHPAGAVVPRGQRREPGHDQHDPPARPLGICAVPAQGAGRVCAVPAAVRAARAAPSQGRRPRARGGHHAQAVRPAQERLPAAVRADQRGGLCELRAGLGAEGDARCPPRRQGGGGRDPQAHLHGRSALENLRGQGGGRRQRVLDARTPASSGGQPWEPAAFQNRVLEATGQRQERQARAQAGSRAEGDGARHGARPRGEGHSEAACVRRVAAHAPQPAHAPGQGTRPGRRWRQQARQSTGRHRGPGKVDAELETSSPRKNARSARPRQRVPGKLPAEKTNLETACQHDNHAIGADAENIQQGVTEIALLNTTSCVRVALLFADLLGVQAFSTQNGLKCVLYM